jgi:predicted nucleotidyltransferase
VDTAHRLRTARQAAGLTQRELARRSGVHQPNIAAYESGRRTPSGAVLQRLFRALEPRPSSLVDRYRDQIADLARRHRGQQVRVFGSIARGQDEPGSDLDLLVDFAPDADLFDLAELTAALEELLGIRVDVVSTGALRPDDEHVRREAVPL